ncbi:MAG: hypothetical protein II937_14285 [Bacteroidales bacterium]|nr:hypothetical protein [Bacteroidales bacterium]
MKKTYLILPLLLLILSCATSCVAQDSVSVNETITQHYNRLLKEKLGDSIATIVINAKRAVIVCDSVAKKLSSGEVEIAKYLVSDTCNYDNGAKAQGLFYNYLELAFKNKKETVRYQFDFVLNKMRIIGGNGKGLCEKDLRSYEILNFGLLAFPGNEYLKRFKTEKK